ncbi:LOW QUALITY PROTEIN: protein phosphatase 1 regulatory subunit 3C [Colossoma macropomum]|uniref:LOW QUALITY PROTEIN: protein phosphatase 1 regulatory subunit 3C n=1 Tax=Colossoma macropomum TaxID=42526 RepID=UPI0018650699|nr:LOW QUALITY PROTEIN: protein phosphatase 1 regulatory subunit 3C [Colossoma macropomum]
MTAAKVMPVDLTMHMGLSRRAAVRQRSDISLRYQHTIPRSSTPTDNSHPSGAASPPQLSLTPVIPMNSASSGGTLKKKKRVVFADAKGLALTAVRLFTVDPPEPEPDTIPQSEKPKDQPPVQGRILRLRLGFPQPSADLQSFLGGLAGSLVQLESCSLMGGLLSGMVRVCNISLEKAVHIRITFDSWRTHKDIPCTHVKQQPGSETDLFSFSVSFPSDLNLQDRVEFCVSFRPGSGSTLLWDNNSGQNYRIFVDVVDPEDVPLAWSRPFMTQSPKRPKAWPKRQSQIVHYPACFKPRSPNNMTLPPMCRQENIMPLC